MSRKVIVINENTKKSGKVHILDLFTICAIEKINFHETFLKAKCELKI